MRYSLIFLALLSQTVASREITPTDGNFVGAFLMSAYLAKLLTQSECVPYSNFRNIDLELIKSEVLNAHPPEGQKQIRKTLASDEWAKQARLDVYGGIAGLVKSNMADGHSKEVACGRIAGHIETEFKSNARRWTEILEE